MQGIYTCEQTNEYADKIKDFSDIKEVMKKLETEFNIFIESNKIVMNSELDVLRNIKIFLHRNKADLRQLRKNTILSNGDCLTLSIITCILAESKGYHVFIGKPDVLSRYFHAVIVRQNGEVFKVVGKRNNYDAKIMEVSDVTTRLRLLYPIIRLGSSVKKRIKKILN